MDGRIISHYQLLEKIGEGGMGVVYKAQDLNLPRIVALKFLAPNILASKDAHQRFVQEAALISTLNHPHIATIFEFGRDQDEPFLALEYLPGGSLRDKVLEHTKIGRQLPIDQASEYAAQIAEGLRHAHRFGIVHRDVKTGNALLTEDGRIKITDFGLSKVRAGAQITRTGSALGTIQYMSPEQARGEDVDERSDIFSLGVVFYELLTGQRPFRGEHDAVVLHQIQSATPEPVHKLRPEVPAQLQNAVEKALQKRPERRYQSMDELLADLRPFRTDPSTGSHPSALRTVTLAPRERGEKRPLRRSMVALVLLAALAATVAFIPGVRQWIAERFTPVPVERKLVVLPFQNIGGDPAGQAFCDGLMEVLTSKLTQLEQFQNALWVVPAVEVRNQAIKSPREAQRAFGVNLALAGSVQRNGLVVMNLIDARSLRQLHSFDERFEEVAAHPDRLVTRVAALLQVELRPNVRQLLAAGAPAAPAAYDYYLQGYGYLRRTGLSQENAENAIRLFQQALQREKNYALAYSGLGEAYWRMYGITKDRKWVSEARSSSRRALQLDDRLAPVHVTAGLIELGAGERENAIREYRKALAIEPANPDAYGGLATAYEASGKLPEAEATYKRAIELRRSYWGGYSALGIFYTNHARYAEAEPLFQRAIDLTPDNYNGYRNLGGLYFLMGRYDQAVRALQKANGLHPSARAYSNLGTIRFFQGRYREAARDFERAESLSAKDYIIVGNLADAYRWTPELAGKAPPTYRRAIELAEQQLEVNPKSARAHISVALYHAKLGENKEALAAVEKARQLAPGNVNVQYQSALVYELVGQRRLALQALETALRAGYSLQEVRAEPELGNLRKDPQFEQMIMNIERGGQKR